MEISVILAHPNKRSFNNAIAETAVDALKKNMHEVNFHEVSDEAPLPKEIITHCKELSSADGIIIIHPNWWGQPPAILKGWIDRIIRPGIAYKFLE